MTTVSQKLDEVLHALAYEKIEGSAPQAGSDLLLARLKKQEFGLLKQMKKDNKAAAQINGIVKRSLTDLRRLSNFEAALTTAGLTRA